MPERLSSARISISVSSRRNLTSALAHSDPINLRDPSGLFAPGILAVVIGSGVLGAISSVAGYLIADIASYQLACGGLDGFSPDLVDYLIVGGIGFTVGAVSPFVGYAVTLGIGALANSVQYVAIESRHGRPIKGPALAVNAITGAVGSGIGYKAIPDPIIHSEFLSRSTVNYMNAIKVLLCPLGTSCALWLVRHFPTSILRA